MNWSVKIILIMTFVKSSYTGGIDRLATQAGIRMRTVATYLAQFKKQNIKDFLLVDYFEPQKALPAPKLRRVLTRSGSTHIKPQATKSNNNTEQAEDSWKLYADLELDPSKVIGNKRFGK